MGTIVPPINPTVWGDDCDFCSPGKTPLNLTVYFFNLLECSSCIYGGGGPADCFKFLGSAAILNAGKYLLTQTAPCRWVLVDNGNFGTDERWNCDLLGEKCTTFISSIPTTPLTISIIKTGNTAIQVEAKFRATDVFFTFTGDVSAILAQCMNVPLISNDLGDICKVWTGVGNKFCINGEMRIREGDWT